MRLLAVLLVLSAGLAGYSGYLSQPAAQAPAPRLLELRAPGA